MEVEDGRVREVSDEQEISQVALCARAPVIRRVGAGRAREPCPSKPEWQLPHVQPPSPLHQIPRVRLIRQKDTCLWWLHCLGYRKQADGFRNDAQTPPYLGK